MYGVHHLSSENNRVDLNMEVKRYTYEMYDSRNFISFVISIVPPTWERLFGENYLP